VTPPKRKPLGRPPIDPTDRSVYLTVAIPSRRFDALCKRASDSQRTVAAQVRAELKNEK